MGVCIEGTKEGTTTLDMSYSGFCRLRKTIANLIGENFGKKYEEYVRYSASLFPFSSEEETDKFFLQLEKEINEIIDSKKASKKVMDFLFSSDCEGKISYGSCKDLLKVIGTYDNDIVYGYAAWSSPSMFKDFKQLLAECIENKCNLIWY